MKKLFFYTIFALLILVIVAIGCKKNELLSGPTLTFIIDSGYLYSDTLIPSGDTANIGLICEWNGTNIIKSFNIYMNGNLYEEPFQKTDSMGRVLNIEVQLTKSLKTIEKWEFEVFDDIGHITRIGLNIAIDNTGGNIKKINAIAGAQTNAAIGSFYNIYNGFNYMQDEANLNQNLIDIICGYDFVEGSFITSPGSGNWFGVYDLSAWSQKNITQFCPTNFTKNQFELIGAANLLISSFYPEKASNYIHGFKTNDIFSIKTNDGKYGLLLILAPATSGSGFMTFDVKIQE